MIGFGLNIAGGLLNLWLYKKYQDEKNLWCVYFNAFFAVFFLTLALAGITP